MNRIFIVILAFLITSCDKSDAFLLYSGKSFNEYNVKSFYGNVIYQMTM